MEFSKSSHGVSVCAIHVQLIKSLNTFLFVALCVCASSCVSHFSPSHSLWDCSPSFSSQCLFNHAVCVNELRLEYRCVGRTLGYRSDWINMRTPSPLSLSDLLRWFKWKFSLVFMLLQMSADAHAYTRADNGRLLSVRRLSADLFDSRPVISLSTFTQPYYLRRCLKMRNVLVCISGAWIGMFVSCEMFTCVCVDGALTGKWGSAGR